MSLATSNAASLLESLQGRFGPKVPVALARERSVVDGATGVTRLPMIARETLCLPGATVELSGLPGAGLRTLALLSMLECLAASMARGASTSWVGAIDPARLLHAPAVAALGLPLSRFVVVAPPQASLARLSVRVMRSGAFCALFVDATSLDQLDGLGVAVRRLTLAAEAVGGTVFLATSSTARRSLPLATAARALVSPSPTGIAVEILRHRQGQPPPFVVESEPSLVARTLHPRIPSRRAARASRRSVAA
jgi:hypothetical protein